MTDSKTVVTLVNLHASEARTLIVQGGAYGEHRIESVESAGRSHAPKANAFTVRLEPGAGSKLTLQMKRYAVAPTIALPWERK